MVAESIDPRLDQAWRENINKLKAYKKKYGNFNVPSNWKEDRPFAQWVENIRRHPGRLPLPLKKALQKLKFEFAISRTWNDMFRLLESFYQRFGHSYVPPLEREYERLFDWTVAQRQNKNRLTKIQFNKLNGLHFEWQEPNDKDLRWQRMYGELMEFKRQHGHTRVSSAWTNRPLARWVSGQRENERTMASSRKKALDAAGFYWYADIRKLDEQVWQTRYRELKQFQRQFGHFKIPVSDKQHYSLRIWISVQRRLEDKMHADRKKLLNAIKFPWKRDIAQEKVADWHSFYRQLVAYYKKHGNTQVNNHSKTYPKLGPWVQRQRLGWKELESAKRKLLGKLNFLTSEDLKRKKDKQWLTMFAALERYRSKHGHSRVLATDKVNRSLARWVEGQRRDEQNLQKGKINMLNSLGFLWSRDLKARDEQRWHKMYRKLERFYKRYGHSSVPYEWKPDLPLSNWVNYQRKPKTPLSKEKKDLLKKVKFQFNTRRVRPRKRNKVGRYVTDL